ncbi:unnamed protein product [Peronospora destructor]|uniref:Uncharacterized protein n=1 Tax=Peronospora destructor TaxID=86335 RepID=A0AAV0T395_9STRA|nr:unnamed protein product [Peronospora destructor]
MTDTQREGVGGWATSSLGGKKNAFLKWRRRTKSRMVTTTDERSTEAAREAAVRAVVRTVVAAVEAQREDSGDAQPRPEEGAGSEGANVEDGTPVGLMPSDVGCMGALVRTSNETDVAERAATTQTGEAAEG